MRTTNYVVAIWLLWSSVLCPTRGITKWTPRVLKRVDGEDDILKHWKFVGQDGLIAALHLPGNPKIKIMLHVNIADKSASITASEDVSDRRIRTSM